MAERETATKAVERWLRQHPDWVTRREALAWPVLIKALQAEPPNVQRRTLEACRALEPLSPDGETLSALLVYARAVESPPQAEEMVASLPEAAQPLLKQLLTLRHYGQTYLPTGRQNAEGLRRLLLALVADVRVVLIALAWQVASLRQVDRQGESDGTDRAKQIAQETQLIHAPLANRLGIWQLKWPLEDLAFRLLEPRQYQRIQRLVDERQSEREQYVEQFMQRLQRLAEESGVTVEVSGRAKHIYSIWRKMQRKGLDFHELFDVRAVRVLVETVADCYTVLGLVHTHWTPVPGEFDDYITNPKPNLYQSLHTAVTAAGGRAVEVQIRTHEMHRHAELGVAAHWRYKEGGPRDSHLENRIGVMRQLLEGGEAGDDDLLEGFQNLTSEDRVYVLTPKGEVKDLVAGSTPLDFAYLVHTEVGHRCRGARVNGRIVPLTTELKNGDRVEVLTGRESRPSRDWLSPRLGFLHSARARAKVRQWFNQAHYDEHLVDGRQAMEQELKRFDFSLTDLDEVLAQFNFGRQDDLLVAVGRGELTASQVAKAIERKQASESAPSSLTVVRPNQSKPTSDDVRIEGVGKLLHQFARCCQPVPGDAVIGYLTRARGVSIHRQDCGQVRNLERQHPERMVAVRWADQASTRYIAKVQIEAWDRRELIKDIGMVLAADSVNITDMSAQHAEDDPEQVTIRLAVQVSDFDQLSALLAKLSGLNGVTLARRLR